MFDLIIKNALIYDGSGAAAFYGNIAVKDGKIAMVTAEPLEGAAETIDAHGLALAPGFIDVHSHSDQTLFTDPHRVQVLRMGVTTEISGQCGNSRSPASANMTEETRIFQTKKHSPLYDTMKQQLEAVDTWELGPNQRFFTGHGLLRSGVMQLAARHADDQEIALMQKALAQAIQEGSAGLSTGLSYVPGIYSNTHELTELARTAGQYGGMYTTHSRSESMGLFDNMNECIHIAREGKVSVNISHFKCVGKVFWERCEKALGMIDAALEEGLDITLDAYPYIAASTTTLSAIPARFQDRGAIAFAKSLEDPKIVEEIRREIYEINDPSWDNSMYYVGLENFLIVRAAETPWAIGKTYAQAARELGMEPFDAVIHLLKANHGTVYECRFSMCEENVEAILKHPKCMVGSDGIYNPGDKLAHPRAFGTFPRYLGHYIRERGILSREEGIHRITGMPAKRYGLKGKGFIREGCDADMILFDYDTIRDRADFMDPFKPNEGIHQLYIGGELVLENNEPTGVWNGKYLR